MMMEDGAQAVEETMNIKNNDRNLGKKRKKKTCLKNVFDHWVLFQLLSIFLFSFAMGMLFMHATILWHQYKHGYGFWSRHSADVESVFRDHMEVHLYGMGPRIYEWSHGQLRVNTSIFVR